MLSPFYFAYAKLRMENVKSPRSFSILNYSHPCVNPAIPGKINAVMKMKLQTPAVFALGAVGYAALELLWRGRTHWTMALTGGAVLVGLRRLRQRVHEENPLSRCLCGAASSRPRNMWSAARSTGISGCACGITRTNSATFKDRSAKYAVLWTLLAAPIMLPK